VILPASRLFADRRIRRGGEHEHAAATGFLDLPVAFGCTVGRQLLRALSSDRSSGWYRVSVPRASSVSLNPCPRTRLRRGRAAGRLPGTGWSDSAPRTPGLPGQSGRATRGAGSLKESTSRAVRVRSPSFRLSSITGTSSQPTLAAAARSDVQDHFRHVLVLGPDPGPHAVHGGEHRLDRLGPPRECRASAVPVPSDVRDDAVGRLPVGQVWEGQAHLGEGIMS